MKGRGCINVSADSKVAYSPSKSFPEMSHLVRHRSLSLCCLRGRSCDLNCFDRRPWHAAVSVIEADLSCLSRNTTYCMANADSTFQFRRLDRRKLGNVHFAFCIKSVPDGRTFSNSCSTEAERSAVTASSIDHTDWSGAGFTGSGCLSNTHGALPVSSLYRAASHKTAGEFIAPGRQ